MTAPNTQTGNGGSGGTSQGGAPGPVTVNVGDGGGSEGSRTQRRADAVQGITDRLVAKYGTLEAALTVLAGENYEYREQLRTQGEELATIRKKVPADGSFVLTADQKKAWDAIVATNVPIDKVAERIKRAGELETAQSEAEFGKLVDQGAAAVKFNGEVLRGLLRDKGYSIELRDVIVDGKASKAPYIRKTGDDKAAWELLTTAAEKEFKVYLPALQAIPQGGNGGSADGTLGGTGSTVSHDMPSQSSSSTSQGGGGAGSVVDKHLAKTKARSEKPNPLRPAPAAKS